ncbi:hypothetical protein K439DRAFT_1229071, partial [Ramaria rubella]
QLTHPSIKDGWFRKISSQWPEAIMLKVLHVLHVQKSEFQDVLVFASETSGNVLVLDGVIQCIECDEFLREMIAPIPLASHPHPKKVLVISGGDGGVVREVLKYPSVEQVVLCDIDHVRRLSCSHHLPANLLALGRPVVRVAKLYLPHMATLLASPHVRVHIGNGFAFLATYDAIITDSSHLVSPAAALFQSPY